ncbi:MAG: DNA gyrase C-terminal beta-propeller domain-containing protein, partial [Clostridia bacterium]|nr:DNA gyrase C-terminal beta-propeller domain-containing protein [Clostridia bacterium]
VISENGYGKRTPVAHFRKPNRGGKGVYAMRCNEKTGDLVAILVVRAGDEIMIISREGVVIRVPASDISEQGRYAQGVRIIKLDEGDAVVDMAKVVSHEDKDDDLPELPAKQEKDQLASDEIEDVFGEGEDE